MRRRYSKRAYQAGRHKGDVTDGSIKGGALQSRVARELLHQLPCSCQCCRPLLRAHVCQVPALNLQSAGLEGRLVQVTLQTQEPKQLQAAPLPCQISKAAKSPLSLDKNGGGMTIYEFMQIRHSEGPCCSAQCNLGFSLH